MSIRIRLYTSVHLLDNMPQEAARVVVTDDNSAVCFVHELSYVGSPAMTQDHADRMLLLLCERWPWEWVGDYKDIHDCAMPENIRNVVKYVLTQSDHYSTDEPE